MKLFYTIAFVILNLLSGKLCSQEVLIYYNRSTFLLNDTSKQIQIVPIKNKKSLELRFNIIDELRNLDYVSIRLSHIGIGLFDLNELDNSIEVIKFNESQKHICLDKSQCNGIIKGKISINKLDKNKISGTFFLRCEKNIVECRFQDVRIE